MGCVVYAVHVCSAIEKEMNESYGKASGGALGLIGNRDIAGVLRPWSPLCGLC